MNKTTPDNSSVPYERVALYVCRSYDQLRRERDAYREDAERAKKELTTAHNQIKGLQRYQAKQTKTLNRRDKALVTANSEIVVLRDMLSSMKAEHTKPSVLEQLRAYARQVFRR